ncbi:NAD(P)H-binding protein [Streptomyces sp. NPDC002790]|uniref:NAD(P)H-binding protein n=1 Tax=Streptomyces sp. NPDC002790 TaxID=3154431 RepID=UPI00332428DA
MTGVSPSRLPLCIAVTGATGTVGRETVARLAPICHVRSLTRDPIRAAQRGTAGKLVAADCAVPQTLVEALRGADALFAITSDPLQPDHDRNLLAAAREAGVPRVVKLSAMAVTDPRAQDLITRRQRESEELVRSAGLDWTLLRPRAYMTNTLSWAATIKSHGVVRALYGTSPNACIDPRDIARAAAHVLTTPGHHQQAYSFSGPHAMSALDQTRCLSQVLDRRIDFEELTEEQAFSAWCKRYNAPMANALLDSARRQAAGAKERVTASVEQLTGQAPASYAQWARDHSAAFA